jgi:aryl-alcohol dehydrogenase-like predicted oxidoreductase
MMETRRLGRLGFESSVLVYGGAALGDVPEEVADRSIALALEAGINHFDTAADYGGSEAHLGRWMPKVRDRVFLATKTGERSAAGAAAEIRRSLERLRVDRIDLIQLHAVCDLEDLDRATRPGGALEAALRARDEGLVGAIGITGHGMRAPEIHLEALRRFPFDSVITPYSFRLAQDDRYRASFEALLEVVREEDVALRAIKACARNLWRRAADATYDTWYEPLDEQRAVTAAVTFALARPEIAGICTPGDVRLLPLVLRAERERASMGLGEATAILSAVPDYEPPFVRVPGREVPEWLAPLLPG